MKRFLIIAACLLLTSVASLAQPGGGMFFGKQIEKDSTLVAIYSRFMVEKYKLNEDQARAVIALNNSYVGKIQFPISRDLREKYREARSAGNNEVQTDSIARSMREQFRNMENITDEQRQQMMAQMQKRMEEAQAAQEKMEENQARYENALQQIMDKSQFKAYKKEVRREEEREQRRREGEMRRQFERGGFGGPGGFGPGGPGGGFGGPGGAF